MSLQKFRPLSARAVEARICRWRSTEQRTKQEVPGRSPRTPSGDAALTDIALVMALAVAGVIGGSPSAARAMALGSPG